MKTGLEFNSQFSCLILSNCIYLDRGGVDTYLKWLLLLESCQKAESGWPQLFVLRSPASSHCRQEHSTAWFDSAHCCVEGGSENVRHHFPLSFPTLEGLVHQLGPPQDFLLFLPAGSCSCSHHKHLKIIYRCFSNLTIFVSLYPFTFTVLIFTFSC